MKSRSLYINIFFDVLAVSLAFFIMIWIKPATKRFYLPNYFLPFLIFLFNWIAISIITRKYSVPERLKLARALLHIILVNIIITGVTVILMFIFQSLFYSRLVVIGTVGIATLIEIFFAFCDYYLCITKPGPDTSKVFETYQRIVDHTYEFPSEEIIPLEFTLEPVPENIRDTIIEESNIDVFNFLSENIDLNIPNYSLLSTTTRFNVDKLTEKVYLKIVNLKRINDIRFINKFFESVNRKLIDGGFFIGCVETKEQRKTRLLKKYPPILNRIYYFFDYIVKRVFPKFKLTKRIYFFLTRGENRVVSKAETFGRLYSCGFKIVNEREIRGWLYYIARKTRVD